MEQLAWLPVHEDLGAALSAARRIADPAERLARAMHLSGFRRDFTATGRIERLAEAGLAAPPAELGLVPLRLAILASHTVDHLVPGIRVAGLHRGLAISVHVAPYGNYRQALLGEDPALAEFAPQLVLLALDAQDSPIALPLGASEADVEQAVAARVAELRHLWRRARERFNAQVVQQLLVATTPPLFGSYEAMVPAAPRTVLERLNAALRHAAREDGVLLLDLAAQMAGQGPADGLADPVRWHQAKQLVSPVMAPLHGDLVARIAGAVLGRARKCLVLDLDNTLWGGVIGDDGIEGIKLGQGNPTGEAFLAVQRYAAQLGQRGIILAVCSKNDMAVAEAVFENHPEMALRRGDIAAFVANWSDKAGNLRQIAKQLNIGLDALVFLDDNPAERDIVRRELPGVAVPELPEDVALYPAWLGAAGYFETVGFTADDAARGRSYALNAARQAALEQTTDLESYLRSLEMVLTARRIGPAELPRATQLINKTNQFNLTTRRYTEAEVQALADDPASLALALRLTDRFGDNGLISVILARPDASLRPEEWLIDTWLMSCRVLGRQVEAATMQVLTTLAAQQGIHALIGEYRPTARNGMVADHYSRLGFKPMAPLPDRPEGTLVWRYETRGATPFVHPIALDLT
ncbi:HAD-IIIC family phosphatase [Belnapia rosea]|uniref:HAD-IIIC family phosphatase n=1 Tax=Belnapia rosea TaxID=938405 RepID=UPI00089015FB|nr:HAD-IIIC family phosphatase [Belnapia rosea]SDB72044.1 HAD-superfamily phosphatase, subfamily IIIC/FkbH-like domain-containing protein [Belnapia rosea]